jgi:transposase-like protein
MSKKARRKWERCSTSFKQCAVEKMRQGHVRELAKKLGVSVSMLYRWKQRVQEQAAPDAAEDPRDRRVREEEEAAIRKTRANTLDSCRYHALMVYQARGEGKVSAANSQCPFSDLSQKAWQSTRGACPLGMVSS